MVEVKVLLHGLVFPEICPVCGERATNRGFIGKRIAQLPPVMDRFDRLGSLSTLDDLIHLEPLVCKEHATPLVRTNRPEILMAMCSSILLLITFLLMANVFFLAYDTLPIPFERIMILGASALGAGVLLWGIRPSPLVRAISIKKAYPNAGFAVLHIKHDWYAEELLRLNPQKAKPANI